MDENKCGIFTVNTEDLAVFESNCAASSFSKNDFLQGHKLVSRSREAYSQHLKNSL